MIDQLIQKNGSITEEMVEVFEEDKFVRILMIV